MRRVNPTRDGGIAYLHSRMFYWSILHKDSLSDKTTLLASNETGRRLIPDIQKQKKIVAVSNVALNEACDKGDIST